MCTSLTLAFFPRHNLARFIHCRTVSLLASIPCSWLRYSEAKVGPKPLYTGTDKIFTALDLLLDFSVRWLAAQPVNHGFVPLLFQRVYQPLDVPHAEPQLLSGLTLR